MFNRNKPIQDMDAWVEEHLSEYLDGTLSAQDRARVEAHLQTSARARASLESLRWTINLLKQTPAPPLPRQFTLPVTTRVPTQAAPGWMVWGLRGVAAAAGIAFFLLLAATLIRQPGNGSVATQPQAPVAMSVPPTSVAIAQPTPIATIGSSEHAPVDTGFSQTPIMITVESPQAAQQTEPVTLTPPSALAESAPSESSDAVEPSAETDTAPPAPTEVSVAAAGAELAQPTRTRVSAAAPATAPTTSASAASGSAPTELGNANRTPTNAAAAQRKLSPASLEGRVLASQLKVREGPGTQYRVIGGLKLAQRVTIIGRSVNGLWLAIEFPTASKTVRGWIGAPWVTVSGAVNSLPILPAPGTQLPTPEPPTETPLPTETPEATPTPDTLFPDMTPTPEPGSDVPDEATPTPETEGLPVGESQPNLLQPVLETPTNSPAR